jgi:hypothetical protein
MITFYYIALSTINILQMMNKVSDPNKSYKKSQKNLTNILFEFFVCLFVCLFG